MVFSSLLFLFLFLPLNLILYYSTKNRKIRNIILVAFSMVFYAWGEPIWISLLIISAIIDFCNGLFVEKFRGRAIAKLGIYSTIFFNIGLLCTFKYSDFFVENANHFFGTHFGKPGFLLPIGISFYTFQTISYTLDVYRGEIKAQRHFINFLMFVSLYHNLVAGPIVRYQHIVTEIESRIFSWTDFSGGVTRFCKGLFKKVCIANTAGFICAQFLDRDLASMTMVGGWFGLLLFSIQIYFDFSGYSDMAIGLGKMFGFHYHENFKHPYLSISISDFWRRWHISLGTFFKDYIYFPLGGSRKNHFRNIFIVWSLTGFWHGASWNFIIWGLYYGIIIYLEKIFFERLLNKLHESLRHVYAIFFVMVGWSLFYFTSLPKLIGFLKIIFHFTKVTFIDYEVKNAFFENIYWILISIILCIPVYNWVQRIMSERIKNVNLVYSLNIFLNLVFFITSVILLVGSTYNPFLYFRF